MIVSIGIDVGKTSCSVALLHEDRSYSEASFANTSEGVKSCISFFRKAGVSEETPVILESTGGYHLLFAMTIKDTHFRGIKVINAILTKKYQKSKIRKTKTDSLDAKMLANMGLMEDLPSFTQTKEQIIQKKLISLLGKLQKTRQHLKASLESCLETEKNLDVEIDTSGFKKVLETINAEIKNLEKRIIAKGQNPLTKELSEIKGVSESFAAIFSSFIDGKVFSSKEKLVAFTGLDLSIRESGTSIHGARHLSKRGDPLLREKLFKTAWGLKTNNQKYRDYYFKKRNEGKHYYTCLLAVARKFVHNIYGIQKKLIQNNLS